jgi:hypothetical protein
MTKTSPSKESLIIMSRRSDFNDLFRSFSSLYRTFNPEDYKNTEAAYWALCRDFSHHALLDAVKLAESRYPDRLPTGPQFATLCEQAQGQVTSDEPMVVMFRNHQINPGRVSDRHKVSRPIVCGCIVCQPRLWCPLCGEPYPSRYAHGNTEAHCISCGKNTDFGLSGPIGRPPEREQGKFEQMADRLLAENPDGRVAFKKLAEAMGMEKVYAQINNQGHEGVWVGGGSGGPWDDRGGREEGGGASHLEAAQAEMPAEVAALVADWD